VRNNLEIKKQLVEEIKQKIQNNESMVMVSYTGITVEKITELRNKFREAGVEYIVYKNTLVRRALEELGLKGLEEELNGPSAFAFGDAVSPAKIIDEFISDKENAKKMTFKGGVLYGEVTDVANIQRLAKLPSRDELIAGFVFGLSAVPRSLVYVLDSIRKQKEEAA
jgi:large subunit ribosomal protein L10